MNVTKCGVMVGLFVWGVLAMPAAHAQAALEVIPSVTNVCLTLQGFNSSSGQPVGQVTAGWGCSYQASGCITINIGCSGSCNSSDPDGDEYTGGTCAGSSTNTTAGQGFACPGLVAYSLVAEVNGDCVQLGASGTFTAPSTGLLSVYFNDDDYYDDGGSFNVCIQMPDAGLVSSGGPGGPFSPSSCVYTLTNSSAASLVWSATNGQNWVSLSSTGGILAAAASATVTISINTNANALAAGVYTDSVSFANLTSGNGSTARPVSLSVIAVPSAPSGLTAYPGTLYESQGMQINLSWGEGSADVDGYAIESAPDVGGAPGTWAQIAVQVGGDYRGYTELGLPMATTYWYRMRAYNGGGYSPYSNVATAQTFSLPAAPTSLIATSTPYGDITLHWVNVATNASGNIIWRALDNGGVPGTWTLDRYAATNTTNVVESGLASGTIYWYTVQAYNNIGDSPYSNFASAITAGPPPTPSNLVAVVVASNQVNLSWAEVAGSVTGFQISRGSEGTVIATVSSNVTTYSDLTVTTNKTYSYWVSSFNSYGGFGYLGPVSVSIPTIPPAPSALSATAVATNQINLSWTDNSNGQAQFLIQRALDNVGSPGTWSQIGAVSTNVTIYSDTGLAATTRYWYRVSATNVSGDSPFSNLANATTASGTNVWINPLSDKWEIAPNWSQGVPSSAQVGVLISNANTKTVTIDAATVASNAVNGCMAVGSLTIFSPVGSTNTLSLVSAGTSVPLHVINSLTVTNGGAINITNAALQVDGTLGMDGTMALQPNGQFTVTNASTYVGLTTTGQVTMTGGSATLRALIVASNAFSAGTFTMTGGNVTYSNALFGVGSNSSASVWLTGGNFTTTNRVFSLIIGRYGNAQLTVSNGATLSGWITHVADGNSSVGTFTLAGGTAALADLSVGSSSNGVGTAWISNAQLITTNQGLYIASSYASGQVTMSNSFVLTGYQGGGIALNVGAGSFSTGTLTIYGGTLTSLDGTDYLEVGNSSGSTGTVWVNGGVVTATNGPGYLFLGVFGSGSWTLSNGTVNVNNLYEGLGGTGTLAVVSGTFSVLSNAAVGYGGGSNSAIWVTGGQFLAPNGLFVLGNYGPGSMTVSGGTAVIRSMIVSSNNAANTSTLTVAGGQVTVFDSLVVGDCGSNAIGQITVSGGTLYVTNATHTGYLDLRGGTLTVSGTGHLVADVFVMTNTCGLFVNDGGSVSFGTAIFNTNLSTVGDGIPDAWRAEYFPNVDPTGRTTNNLSCATCDPDGDGQNNLQEYLAGTDPTNPSSFLRIVSLAQVAGNVQVGFTSVSGKYYTLVRCYSLGGAWTILVDNIPGTGSIRQATDIGGASQSAAFYRIQLNESPDLALVDSIGDGIPDTWRALYFANIDPTGATTNNLSCTMCDADGSGFSNWQDYLVGVDPTNPAAAFRITSVVPTGNNLFVTWIMGSGKTNALQATAGSASGGYNTNNFADIFTVTNTVGTTTNYLDTGAATNVPARYYRVRLVP